MNTRMNIGQLILRLSLGVGFLFPVMDRLGWLGAPGSGSVAWGSWANFVAYTNKLLPFLPQGGASFMGLIATIGEALFLGISAPFNYPVFVFTGGSLLLSGIRSYKWSVDERQNTH